MDLAGVLELEEEAIAAGGRVLDLERDRPASAGLALRVGVQVGLVVLAQGDEVAVGAEVGLDRVELPAVAADGELDRRGRAARRPLGLDLDLVAVAGVGQARRSGQRPGSNPPATKTSVASVNDASAVAKSAKAR